MNKLKKIVKNFFCSGYFRPFWSKNDQIWDHFFPLLCPKDSGSLEKFGHWTLGSGGKKTFKWYLKKRTHGRTDKHTDTHTDILTYRKHWPRGPMLWTKAFHTRLEKTNIYIWLDYIHITDSASSNMVQKNLRHIYFYFILLFAPIVLMSPLIDQSYCYFSISLQHESRCVSENHLMK